MCDSKQSDTKPLCQLFYLNQVHQAENRNPQNILHFLPPFHSPVLQIRESTEDSSKIIFLFLIENICCDPSLESSRRDGSNDGSQNMFKWRNIDNYP